MRILILLILFHIRIIVNADSISLFPIHSSNTNDLKTYPFEKDLNKLILSLEDTDKHAVYKPQ